MMCTAAENLFAMAGPTPPGGFPGFAGDDAPVMPERLRILIVEDDTIIAWTLEALLSDLGHEIVDIASTGERALLSAAEFEPDLVMMDINLGSGMNGIEAAEGIRGRHAAKVVFVSAYGDPDTREKVHQAVPGAPILTKPVRLDALARTLSLIRGSSH
jgi:CheY-like chemotaxis protein